MLDSLLREALDRLPGVLHNVGVAVAPGRLSDRNLFTRVWQPGPGGPEELQLDLDPASPEFYDYAKDNWFADTVTRGAPSITDPAYYDMVDAVLVTATFPLFDDIGLLAVSWTDIDTGPVRRLCAPVLAELPPAAIATAKGVIIAGNDERRFPPGERLDEDGKHDILRSPALEWRLALAR